MNDGKKPRSRGFLAPSALCCLVLSLASSGCTGSPQVNYKNVQLAEVTGTVTFDGKPLQDAVVEFDPDNGETSSYGVTDSSGHYRLRFDSTRPGCTPGVKVVRITTAQKILGVNSDTEGESGETEGGRSRPEEAVPVKYNSKSELKAEVIPGKNSFDFNLKK